MYCIKTLRMNGDRGSQSCSTDMDQKLERPDFRLVHVRESFHRGVAAFQF
uniref:Uncharacterized protein n=1 Tax=Parascaris univalens TaxID=6257 RepID=A0A915AFX7_PARUN